MVSALLKEASASLDAREHESAIASYSKVIALSPEIASALIGRGKAYCELGHWEKALDDLTSAAQLMPDSDLAHNHLANLLATCPTATLPSA